MVTAENSLERIQDFLDTSQDEVFKENLQQSLDVIHQCFQRYKPEEVSVCYNGGKDCIVMLHLVHAYCQKNFPTTSLKSLYIHESNTFPAVDDFIAESVKRYGLDNFTIEKPMKTALEELLQQDSHLQAMVLGVRDGDPGAHLQDFFSPTDGDWPKIMRVNPVLKWRYKDVWTFLRGLSVPYPSLYDEGYTSLGNPENTKPNPALRYTDQSGETRYHPAYMLEDGNKEREGRM